jgi:hypothetical protein
MKYNLNPLPDSTRAGRVALRLLGVFSGSLGLYYGYLIVTEFVRDLDPTDRSPFHLIPAAFGAVFAIWCLWSCYRSLKPRDLPPIRSLSVIVALCVCWAAISYLSVQSHVEDIRGSLISFAIVVSTCAAYVALSWWLASALSVPSLSRRIPQLLVVIVCLQLWVTSSQVSDAVLPREGNAATAPPVAPWGIFAKLVLPIAAALLVAKFLGWISTKREGNRARVPFTMPSASARSSD